VEIDLRKDRIYLPRDEMAEYGITEAQIANRDGGASWQALMMFQIERTRSMLLAGAPLARRLPGRVGLELRMIVMGGSRVLDKLRASRGDVFRHRPILQPYDWLAMLFRSFFAYP
jgi:phytoene/squalene synthetase